MQIGDWGREGGQNQTAVAEAMARKADSFGPEFVISVGDNFYESEFHMHVRCPVAMNVSHNLPFCMYLDINNGWRALPLAPLP